MATPVCHQGGATNNSSYVSQLTLTPTLADVRRRILFVAAVNKQCQNVTSVTWNGVALSQFLQWDIHDGWGRLAGYYMWNPVAGGPHNLTVTWAGNCCCAFVWALYKFADPSGFRYTNYGQMYGKDVGMSCNSQTGDLMVAMTGYNDEGYLGGPTSKAGQTLRVATWWYGAPLADRCWVGIADKPGASSVNIGWTSVANIPHWAQMMYSLKPGNILSHKVGWF